MIFLDMNSNLQVKKRQHWKNNCIEVLKDAENWMPLDIDTGSEIGELLTKKQTLEEKLKITRNKIVESEDKLKENSKNCLNVKSISSSMLKLYGSTTGITFDLESPPNEIKGFIVGNTLTTFQLDVTKYSELEIVNFLWQLIDKECS